MVKSPFEFGLNSPLKVDSGPVRGGGSSAVAGSSGKSPEPLAVVGNSLEIKLVGLIACLP